MNKMSNIQLKRGVNFSEIEKLAEKILAEKPEKLQVPNSLTFSGGFGMEGAVLQLLGTWFRASSTHTLHTSIQDLKPDSFDDLCNSLFGLIALRLSDSILLSGKDEVNLIDALRPAIPILNNIRSEKFKPAFKGLYLALPAIKSPVIKGGINREFDSPLYNKEEVVGAVKFNKITSNALLAIIPRAKDIDTSVVSHLSEIIRELFTNTHRHGRADVYGNSFDKNFRGIIFNSISMTSKRLDDIARSGGGDLSLFIADWKPEGDKQFKALDITVVDSGPGYARRWQKLDKDQLTIELEKESILACFTKHKSTDSADSSGSGLSNVLSDLKALRGWFRLRTGRTLVQKSFFNHDGVDAIELKDIKAKKDFLEGVVFNVVIPLESLLGDR